MASIEDCKTNISNYKDMRTKVKNIIYYLSLYKDDKDSLITTISQNYSLNSDKPSIYNRIVDLSKNVSTDASYLKNTILPAIDQAISDEKDTLTTLEEEEAERKAAEERKKQAASAPAPKQSSGNSNSNNNSTSGTSSPAPKVTPRRSNGSLAM